MGEEEKKVSKTTALLVILLAYFTLVHIFYIHAAYSMTCLGPSKFSTNLLVSIVFTVFLTIVLAGVFRERDYGILLAIIFGLTRVILLVVSGLSVYTDYPQTVILTIIARETIPPIILVALGTVKYLQKKKCDPA